MINYKSIPKNENDLLLNEWGYDLMEEYFELMDLTVIIICCIIMQLLQ